MPFPGPNVEGQTMTLESVAPGVGRFLLSFYVALAQVVNSTDLITAYPLGFKGRIMSTNFHVNTKVTTASKAATLTPKLKSGSVTTTVTGGVIALTSATTGTEGLL